MTVKQVAEHSQRHPKTVAKALRLYRQSQGRKGLRGAQPNGTHSCWRVRREDVDRWCAGEPPLSPRRLHVA